MAPFRIQDVVHELDVVPGALQAYSFFVQELGDAFEVHTVFGNGRVFQEGFGLLGVPADGYIDAVAEGKP